MTIDAAALARELGPEKMRALILATYDKAGYDVPPDTLLGAVTRLAAPVEPEPVWPTKAWAWFDNRRGAMYGVTDDWQIAKYHDSESSWIVRPCRVVSANAVVLTLEEAEVVVRGYNGSAIAFEEAYRLMCGKQAAALKEASDAKS